MTAQINVAAQISQLPTLPMQNLWALWDELFDQLDPDVAVVRVDQPLTGVLVAQRGWTEVAREGSTVLLRAPDVRGLG